MRSVRATPPWNTWEDEDTFVVVLDDGGRQVTTLESWEVAEGAPDGGCTAHVRG